MSRLARVRTVSPRALGRALRVRPAIARRVAAVPRGSDEPSSSRRPAAAQRLVAEWGRLVPAAAPCRPGVARAAASPTFARRRGEVPELRRRLLPILVALAACGPRQPVPPAADAVSPPSGSSSSARLAPSAAAGRSTLAFAVASSTPGRTRARRLFDLGGTIVVGTFGSLELVDDGGLRADEPLRLALSDEAELIGVVGHHPESVFLHVEERRCQACRTLVRRVTASGRSDVVLSAGPSSRLCGLVRAGSRVVALARGRAAPSSSESAGALTVLEGPPLPGGEALHGALGWRRCHLAGLPDGTLIAAGELPATGELALAVLDPGSASPRVVPLPALEAGGAVGLLPLVDGAVVQYERPAGDRRVGQSFFDGKRVAPVELPVAGVIVAASGALTGALFLVVDPGDDADRPGRHTLLLRRASADAPFLPIDLPPSSSDSAGPTDVVVSRTGRVWVATRERILVAGVAP